MKKNLYLVIGIILMLLTSCLTDKKVYKHLYSDNGKYQFHVDGKSNTSYTLSEFYSLAKENPKNVIGDIKTIASSERIFNASIAKLNGLLNKLGPNPKPPFCPKYGTWNRLGVENIPLMPNTNKLIKVKSAGIYRKGTLVSKGKWVGKAINFSDFVNDTNLSEGEYEVRLELFNKETKSSFIINYVHRFK